MRPDSTAVIAASCSDARELIGGHGPRRPLVSAVIIFLNAEPFIREAIESVLAQTYEEWELLLVDDGSTDTSRGIALRYAEQYPAKVRYLEHAHHDNRGMSASRNLGIANAKGEYIAFLDADDVWLPHKLQHQVYILESQPSAAMVYGPTQWWYGWTGKTEDRLRDYVFETGVQANTLVEAPTLLTHFLRIPENSPCTCSVLIRRTVAEQVGGFEEHFRSLYEDQVFFAKVCLSAPVFVSAECSARYRQHANSNCSVTLETEQPAAARMAFLRWLAAYVRKQNSTLSKRLRREIWPCRYPNLDRIYQGCRLGLPGRIFRSVRALKLRCLSLPLIRNLRCLQLRRLQPLGHGRQHGTPIVRHYWETYLEEYRSDIRGIALEIGSTDTIRRFGGMAVSCAEAIDVSPHSPEVTVVADLSRADHVPSERYDCFINQFTMHLIYDAEAALYHSIRILKPGGVLLINFSCMDYYFPSGLDMGTGEPLFLYRWYTPIQVENLFRSLSLEPEDYTLRIYGNLFTRIAYQMNMPAEELTRRELEYVDAGHPLLICARVVKPASWRATKSEYRTPWLPEVTPARWNPVMGHYAT
jgi:glycosyltransferase involved in cell wall biosynthesis